MLSRVKMKDSPDKPRQFPCCMRCFIQNYTKSGEATDKLLYKAYIHYTSIRGYFLLITAKWPPEKQFSLYYRCTLTFKWTFDRRNDISFDEYLWPPRKFVDEYDKVVANYSLIWLMRCRLYSFCVLLYILINVKKLQFIHVLTTTCIDWHIENSKNDKMVILVSSTLTLSRCDDG